MLKGTDILNCDGGTYIVDYDAKVIYGDRFIWLHKETGEFFNLVYPSQVSNYIKVKVTWYYEYLGVDNTNLWKDPEEELTQMLTAQLAAEIDRGILNQLMANNPDNDNFNAI